MMSDVTTTPDSVPSDLPACETCRFFLDVPGDPEGECHRYAPRPAVVRYLPRKGMAALAEELRADHLDFDPIGWPVVERVSWCGEHAVGPRRVYPGLFDGR